ncbi:MAG: TIGR03758 family integrating conjugative element protein [Azonexus sp.]|jgi:integrating conjugative element protein (TIGR03758 family)|nr:TIGR03758 family integrating conjugative element protein [Azonexus sp.]
MKAVVRGLTRFQVWFLLVFPVLALAAIVTAAQIAQAVLNSPNASPTLKQYANAIGALAMNVESGGNTTAYNGSCCYGVLQMTEKNIKHYAQMSAAKYQQLDLQDQINYWAELTSAGLNNPVVQQLINMGTFDGHPVDGALVLSCVQLGTGNCRKTINSGSCSGFADSNGTTICSMADKINNGSSSRSGGSGNTGSTTGSNGSSSPATGANTMMTCIKDASGACLPVNEAMAQAFQGGAGFSMSEIQKVIYALVASGMLLLVIGNMKDVWRRYAKGLIEQHELTQVVIRLAICVMLVLLVVNYA